MDGNWLYVRGLAREVGTSHFTKARALIASAWALRTRAAA